jgi:hypothetical protein
MENVVRDAAEVGRAGELVRVGKPEFFSDFNNPRCPSGEMASVEVSTALSQRPGLSSFATTAAAGQSSLALSTANSTPLVGGSNEFHGSESPSVSDHE